MRMRKKKHGKERIEACSHLLISPCEEIKDNLCSAFPEKRPIHLEIGCGKGNFAVGMAELHKDVNFIAMEKVADVACVALEKAESRKDNRPDNLRFIIADAKNLNEYFPSHSIDCIYLNFSDPWPKKGHTKRRLTYKSFLEIYKNLLTDGGILKFKTDNEGLFDYSIESFSEFGLEIVWQTRDLHNSEMNENNVMTEYEKSFSEKGQPIFSAHVKF